MLRRRPRKESVTPRARVPLQYGEPFDWWGPTLRSPAALGIVDLLAAGVLTAETAAALWALLARRASILVAAGPSRAGKTTLLTALLDFLPAGTQRIYLRGCFEPFAFLHDPSVVPDHAYLLINEISAHLPSYLWGPAVHHAISARAAGFALAATTHATSVEELLTSLTGYPLRLPVTDLAAFDVVVLLDAWQEPAGIHRQIDRIVTFSPVPGQPTAVTVATLAQREDRAAPLSLAHEAIDLLMDRLEEKTGAIDDELSERELMLRSLQGQEPAAVQRALANWHGE